MAGSRWSRREVLGAMSACALAPAIVRAVEPDGLLIRDVRLVDGTGAPARSTDVRVRGGRIEDGERVGNAGMLLRR